VLRRRRRRRRGDFFLGPGDGDWRAVAAPAGDEGCHSSPGCQVGYIDHTGCDQSAAVWLPLQSRVSEWVTRTIAAVVNWWFPVAGVGIWSRGPRVPTLPPPPPLLLPLLSMGSVSGDAPVGERGKREGGLRGRLWRSGVIGVSWQGGVTKIKSVPKSTSTRCNRNPVPGRNVGGGIHSWSAVHYDAPYRPLTPAAAPSSSSSSSSESSSCWWWWGK
jgi:hypothetical protein